MLDHRPGLLKRLFSLIPQSDEGGDWPIWNRSIEHHGSRLRVIVGDLLAESEDDFNAPAGLRFAIDLDLAQEDVREFDIPGKPDARYDIHTLTVIFWRWGIYVAVRGRLYR